MGWIDFRFEGLFMFVQRHISAGGKTPGLYVLIPKSKGMPHEHRLSIEVNGTDIPKFGAYEDWTHANLPPGAGAKLSATLPMSRMLGAVPEDCFGGPLTIPGQQRTIEGRILLPLPQRKPRVGTLVDVVWKKSILPDQWLGPMTGTLTFGYLTNGDVTLGSLGTIRGDATVQVRNTPTGMRIPTSHKKGDPLGHAHLYAGVFDKASPTLVIDEDYDDDANSRTRVAEKTSARDWEMEGVDPVICTASNGCPPEDPDCGGT